MGCRWHVGVLLTLCCWCAAAPRRTEALRISRSTRAYEQRGIKIPGVIENPSTVPVLAHVFFRVILGGRTEVDVVVRGFLYLERVDKVVTLNPQGGGHVTQPDEIEGLDSPVLRLEVSNGTMINITTAGHGDRFRPYKFTTVIPMRQWLNAIALHINDWPRHVQLSETDAMVSHASDHPSEERDAPEQFLLGMYRLSEYYTMAQKVMLVRMQLQWHAALGFQGGVLYEPAPELYAHNPDTAHLLLHNILTIVRWDHEHSGFSWYKENMYSKYDQNVVYNHMLLAYYMRNTYLLLVDTDEYFATPAATTIQALLSNNGCLRPWHHAQAALQRYDAAVLEGDARHVQAELPLWEALNMTVLSKYRHVTTTPFLFKVLAYADTVQQMGVHVGTVDGVDKTAWQDGGQLVPPSCAMLVHFRNLVNDDAHVKIAKPIKDDPEWFLGKRDVADLEERVDWLWPLPAILGT